MKRQLSPATYSRLHSPFTLRLLPPKTLWTTKTTDYIKQHQPKSKELPDAETQLQFGFGPSFAHIIGIVHLHLNSHRWFCVTLHFFQGKSVAGKRDHGTQKLSQGCHLVDRAEQSQARSLTPWLQRSHNYFWGARAIIIMQKIKW